MNINACSTVSVKVIYDAFSVYLMKWPIYSLVTRETSNCCQIVVLSLEGLSVFTDQSGKEVPVVIAHVEGKYRIELNPENTGVYTFHVTFCGKPVPGSPHKCTVYSADRVKVIDLPKYSSIGEEVTFTGIRH